MSPTDVDGDPRGRGDGRIKLFPDSEGGIVCNWKGETRPFFVDDGRKLTEAERRARERKRAESIRWAREKEARRRAGAARRASAIWKAAHPASRDHPYLTRKQTQAHGARLYRGPLVVDGMSCDGSLIVPACDGSDAIHTLEFIHPEARDGDNKRFLPGGDYRGRYFSIDTMEGAGPLCLCEGYATGASIHEATGYPVVVAFNAGNLGRVAQALRARFPSSRLILCADDDAATDGPGLPKATEAAQAVAGLLAVPDFGENRPEGLKDFNDMAALRGSEAVQRAIASAKAPAGDEGGAIHHDRIVTLRELFDEPEESAHWLVEGLFPASGFSAFAAKPKVGKSTLARQLSLAVALGEPFLGRETTQGPVLYVALEEKRGEVRAHFRAMGASGDEPIHVYVASAPQDAISWLCRQIELVHSVLVIIDPLFRLARVRDASAYAEVTNAMEPLLNLARTTGAHVLVTHHTTKRGEGPDAILGSTAIFGSVDTAVVLVRAERYRSIATTQRYGEDLPETVLTWDPDTRTASLGGTREEAEIDRLGKEILAYLSEKTEPVTEALIDEHVEGRHGPKKKALRVLVGDKHVTRIGGGKRGDPFLYVSSSVVPTYTGGPEYQKPKNGLSDCAGGGYSGPQDHADLGGSGNQKDGTEDQKEPDPRSWGTRL